MTTNKDEKPVYTPVTFDERYADEEPAKRYERLRKTASEALQQYRALLLEYRDKTLPMLGGDDEEREKSCSALDKHMEQAEQLVPSVERCWRVTHGEPFSPQVQREAEEYLIQALARLEGAFKNPSDQDNIEQLRYLVEEIPENSAACWHVLRFLLYMFLAVALPLAIVLPMGPAAPAGLVLAITFGSAIIGSFLATRELISAETVVAAQDVKFGLASVTEAGVSFFNQETKGSEDENPEQDVDDKQDLELK